MRFLEAGLQLFNLARPEQRAGMDPRQAHDLGPEDLHPRQGRSQRDRLGQPVFRQATGLFGLEIGVDDPSMCRMCRRFIGVNPAVQGQRVEIIIVVRKVGNQSSPS
ncbi:hypothetical protein GCM10011452_05580 [Gemmobacter lanyuensis]|uniref:Uncharacterized protein n=1 Tax=Gemmobacter lanyuensis TaxID=1054497 RepID=A0A918MHF9_9RHOB|nr:hypothetical protein GCM10011452_05580 [Gemmobacter lanyuensis]